MEIGSSDLTTYRPYLRTTTLGGFSLSDFALFLFRALITLGYFQEIEEVLILIRHRMFPITVRSGGLIPLRRSTDDSSGPEYEHRCQR